MYRRNFYTLKYECSEKNQNFQMDILNYLGRPGNKSSNCKQSILGRPRLESLLNNRARPGLMLVQRQASTRANLGFIWAGSWAQPYKQPDSFVTPNYVLKIQGVGRVKFDSLSIELYTSSEKPLAKFSKQDKSQYGENMCMDQ